MSLGSGPRWYYELCGIRGLFAVGLFRLFGRPNKLKIIPAGHQAPVVLRVDTSDFCAYKDVLVCRDRAYDPELPGFEPKVIVDAGAQIGMASILLARKYPSAKIIAVEPEPSNFAALVQNTAFYNNILPVQAALWKADGEVRLGVSRAHPKGAFEVVESGIERVRAVSMETLMRETGISSIDLLKVDIEGAEREVFEAAPWINRVRVIAIELHDRIKPGCRSSVERAARNFHALEKGEITMFFDSRFFPDGESKSLLGELNCQSKQVAKP